MGSDTCHVHVLPEIFEPIKFPCLYSGYSSLPSAILYGNKLGEVSAYQPIEFESWGFISVIHQRKKTTCIGCGAKSPCTVSAGFYWHGAMSCCNLGTQNTLQWIEIWCKNQTCQNLKHSLGAASDLAEGAMLHPDATPDACLKVDHTHRHFSEATAVNLPLNQCVLHLLEYF